jgi:hypothetical protein
VSLSFADGLDEVTTFHTAQRDALYCLSSSADGSLLVAGGTLCPMSTVQVQTSMWSLLQECMHGTALFGVDVSEDDLQAKSWMPLWTLHPQMRWQKEALNTTARQTHCLMLATCSPAVATKVA